MAVYVAFNRKGELTAAFVHWTDAQIYLARPEHYGYTLEDEPGWDMILKGMVLAPHIRLREEKK